jgi:hypothetical protein
MQPLDIGSCLKRGWQTLLAEAATLIGGYLLLLLVLLGTLGLAAEPMAVGYLRAALRAARGEKVQVGDVFWGFSVFGPALRLAILRLLLVAAGVVLIAVPILGAPGGWANGWPRLVWRLGLLWYLVVQFLTAWAGWLMADGQLSARACLRESVAILRGDPGRVLAFLLAAEAIGHAGILVRLGSVLTGPLATAMMAHGYARSFPRPDPDRTEL